MSSENAVPKQASSSPASFVVAAGAFISGAAVATLALRGRGGAIMMFQRSAVDQEKAIIKQAMESMNSTLDGLRQDVQQTVANAARAELSGVSRKMDNLETIFISPKRRGAFGELQLEGIISNVFPRSSFQFEPTLSNGKKPDCLLKLPQPIGDLAIDSKFPMKSFLELSKIPLPSLDAKAESPELVAARKDFSANLIKHVKDIADRYIIPGETADSALLFVPSEALFLEIVEHHASVVTKAYQLHVWIAGPTTLMAVLTTMRGVVRGIAVNERTDAIVSELKAILEDVDALEKLAKTTNSSIETIGKRFGKVQLVIDKMLRKKEMLDSLDRDVDDVIASSPSPLGMGESGGETKMDEVADVAAAAKDP
mmetsp:Transcript_7054/g.14708  ORF Transcript_7054/g.14708 Transcript_7054/m.14708 type:complete len:369 (-) Transcript_7054:253-1359(-)